MATKFNQRLSLAIAAMMVLFAWQPSVEAQVQDLTFSRDATSESAVDTIEFLFGIDAEEVEIDQLGAIGAILQNNDSDGAELFLVNAGPIDRIGLVGIGELLTFGDNPSFATDFVDLRPAADIGDDVYVGFESSGNVGYFNVSFDAVTDSIFYSEGVFGSGGESLIVAIPEPSSIVLLTMVGGLAMVRRRRK